MNISKMGRLSEWLNERSNLRSLETDEAAKAIVENWSEIVT